MRIHRAITHQAEAVVHVQIGARLRKELPDPRNLIPVFGQMTVDIGVGVFASEPPCARELFIG